MSRFEDFVERLIEGGFSRLLRGRLEPVAIAKRLVRAMEDGRVISADKVFVPNRYRVLLNSRDLEEFKSFREGLERELAAHLAETARERGYSFIGRPEVTLLSGESIDPGGVGVRTKLSDATSLTGDESPEITQRLRTEELTAEDESDERFVLVAGEREIPVTTFPLTLGRHLENDVILEDPSVSRRHAQIIQRFGKYLIRDLDSANGTAVNDELVGQCLLRDGDVIRLGDVEVTFRRAGER